MMSECELSEFNRKLMSFVYPASVISAEYEVEALMKPVTHEYVVVDDNLYKLHFGQYFRYDVRTQMPCFYRSVQKVLGAICRELSSTWQQGTNGYLSLTPFDPELVHRGSDDRCIDYFVGTCGTLSRFHLMDDSISTAVLRQYREVTQFFKKKWASTDLSPVVDDVVSLWLSYPYWSRCQELLTVVKVLFGLNVNGTYVPDFIDEVDVAMPADTLRSSLHLVRSWLRHSYAGHTRQTVTGLLRVCETSDMQVSGLANDARPWDQLLKSGLGEALSLGNSVLSNALVTTPTVPIDDYHSSVLAQLNLVEVMSPPRPGRRSSPIAANMSTGKKGARLQNDVAIGASSSTAVSSGRKGRKSGPKCAKVVGTPSSSRGTAVSRHPSGRRTGGGPKGKKSLTLASVDGSDDGSAMKELWRKGKSDIVVEN